MFNEGVDMGLFDKISKAVGDAVENQNNKRDHYYDKLSSKSDNDLKTIVRRNEGGFEEAAAKKVLRERGY